MKISTKTLASLLAAASATIQLEVAKTPKWRRQSRFERLLQRHDRKCELRSGLLGQTPEAFRQLYKKQNLSLVVRQCGFLNEYDYHVALIGKMRAELHHRGWTSQRIDQYVERRKQRFA